MRCCGCSHLDGHLSFLFLLLFVTSLQRASHADDAPVQDTCPAAPHAEKPHVFINGLPCKNPNNISASDFKSSGLARAGSTTNFLRSSDAILTAAQFPGLNTLGLGVGRTDLGPGGLVLPHSHPRASEMLYVTRGAVVAGFVDTAGRLFKAIVSEGGVFVFPRGLIHFCVNTRCDRAATAVSVFNSQNPGRAGVADGVLVSAAAVAEKIMSWLVGLAGLTGTGYVSGNGTVGGCFGDVISLEELDHRIAAMNGRDLCEERL
ncbi:hypothetical protein Taro_005963 [Colocasia esculenta]|uniref:Germin-like protein n=1 Tax=Colocasia esculenta TaxID=4460 RepID=A0A843TZC6_COLES|nr:hypothetical protein [Colocasia esculenta]